MALIARYMGIYHYAGFVKYIVERDKVALKVGEAEL